MAQVTLVCTAHGQRGAYTADALIEVLRELDPDVIYLEQRPADLEALVMRTPEGFAAHRYGELRSSARVAVDQFDARSSLRGDMDQLFDFVERTSKEFNECVAKRNEMAEQGLESINSRAFEELATRCDAAMERAVAESREDALKSVHADWIALHRGREIAMVTNIYRHCRANPGSRGVFLVGAAHLSPIMARIEAHIAREPSVARWELWNRPGRFSNSPDAT